MVVLLVGCSKLYVFILMRSKVHNVVMCHVRGKVRRRMVHYWFHCAWCLEDHMQNTGSWSNTLPPQMVIWKGECFLCLACSSSMSSYSGGSVKMRGCGNRDGIKRFFSDLRDLTICRTFSECKRCCQIRCF